MENEKSARNVDEQGLQTQLSRLRAGLVVLALIWLFTVAILIFRTPSLPPVLAMACSSRACSPAPAGTS